MRKSMLMLTAATAAGICLLMIDTASARVGGGFRGGGFGGFGGFRGAGFGGFRGAGFGGWRGGAVGWRAAGLGWRGPGWGCRGAGWGWRRPGWGWGAAALGAAAIGAGVAASSYYPYDSGYGYGAYDYGGYGGGCVLQAQPVWTGWGYQQAFVRVCY